MIDNHCDCKHKRRVSARLDVHNVFVSNALQILLDAVVVIARDARDFLFIKKQMAIIE